MINDSLVSSLFESNPRYVDIIKAHVEGVTDPRSYRLVRRMTGTRMLRAIHKILNSVQPGRGVTVSKNIHGHKSLLVAEDGTPLFVESHCLPTMCGGMTYRIWDPRRMSDDDWYKFKTSYTDSGLLGGSGSDGWDSDGETEGPCGQVLFVFSNAELPSLEFRVAAAKCVAADIYKSARECTCYNCYPCVVRTKVISTRMFGVFTDYSSTLEGHEPSHTYASHVRAVGTEVKFSAGRYLNSETKYMLNNDRCKSVSDPQFLTYVHGGLNTYSSPNPLSYEEAIRDAFRTLIIRGYAANTDRTVVMTDNDCVEWGPTELNTAAFIESMRHADKDFGDFEVVMFEDAGNPNEGAHRIIGLAVVPKKDVASQDFKDKVNSTQYTSGTVERSESYAW